MLPPADSVERVNNPYPLPLEDRQLNPLHIGSAQQLVVADPWRPTNSQDTPEAFINKHMQKCRGFSRSSSVTGSFSWHVNVDKSALFVIFCDIRFCRINVDIMPTFRRTFFNGDIFNIDIRRTNCGVFVVQVAIFLRTRSGVHLASLSCFPNSRSSLRR